MTEDSAESIKVFAEGRGVDDDIVKVNETSFPLKTSEYQLHQTLEGGRSVGEPKRHDVEFEEAAACGESSLAAIGRIHIQLPVTTSQVKGREVC